VRLKSTEEKVNKNKRGRHLLVVWEILSGGHEGRLLFDRFTIESISYDREGEVVANEMAMQIGRRRLSDMSWALCHPQWGDTEELHDRTCKVWVVVRQSEQYGPSNDVKSYEAISPADEDRPPAFGEGKPTLEWHVKQPQKSSHMVTFDDDDIPF